MLPWVLLYGFTAMLFNHSTWFSDSRIETVSFEPGDLASLPGSREIAEKTVALLSDQGLDVRLSEPVQALYTRSAFVSYETEEADNTLVLDLNTGQGYKRSRSKPRKSEADNAGQDQRVKDLAKGVSVSVQLGDSLDVTPVIRSFEKTLDSTKTIKLQSIPVLEFDAYVDGKLKKLRFSQQSSRRRGGATQSGSESQDQLKLNTVVAKVSSVGDNPRSMSWRSYLLRLHMAHGYPNTRNARFWWAYVVDAMFVCMVFWGCSGVFMWWQIKRTRVFGFVLLFLSGVIATYLAFAMHWQLVHG
jgi:hypothetical protein